ncbi:MAG: NAD(P)-binding domain-containing protein, partial [Myxococcales bacterium]|nr:NAD(P)-binding domain-containing protein [Myxococcales bacterium]
MEVERIAVIGAGTMGNGIAGQAALSGFHVVLNDIDPARVRRAFAEIEKTWAKGVQRGKLTEAEAAAARERLFEAHDLASAVADADLVIEAVPEQIELKKALFMDLERHAHAEALLATNTSSLSVTEIAAFTSAPERVVGMHFFNPVAVMPLVELVRGEQTSESTLRAA